eukprot:1534546-Amphidinium_carterae.1
MARQYTWSLVRHPWAHLQGMCIKSRGPKGRHRRQPLLRAQIGGLCSSPCSSHTTSSLCLAR